MADPFHSLAIAGSGLDVYQTWLDAIADNIANINNVTSLDEPSFQERFVVAQAVNGREEPGGARVASIEFGDAEGQVSYQPEHPLADEDGFVKVPNVNLAQQMTHLLVAQRAYQANVSAFRAARDAYQRALEIGRR